VRRLLIGASVLLVCAFAHVAPRAQDLRLTRVAAISPAQARQWDARIDRMVGEGDLRLRSTTPDELLPGRLHERLDQQYHGVPVFGADIAREIDGDTVAVFGQLFSDIVVDTTPTLSALEAEEIVDTSLGFQPTPVPAAQLFVLPTDDGSFALVWQVRRFTGDDMRVYLIDAHTGAVALRYSDLKTQTVGKGIGVLGDAKKMSTSLIGGTYVAEDKMRPPRLITYDLRGNLARTMQLLDDRTAVAPATSDEASDADNNWTDGVVVDAHTYLGWTYDYYFKRFNRRGLNDNSTASLQVAMFGITHPVNRANLPNAKSSDLDYYVNAFWCPQCGTGGSSFMMFGEGIPTNYYTGDGQWINYLAASLDVVAHELTHGVTDYSSRLFYESESGALNEAFSDIMGTSVEFYFQPHAADLANNTGTLTADYLMGEDSFRPSPYRPGSRAGIRSLANPSVFGDPDHWSKRYIPSGPPGADNDWGGVHTNSTIISHAFYLAIEGGTNRTSGLTVQGVGDKNREQIEKIFYRAFVYNLPSRATFSTARVATIQAARDLYGTGSAAEAAVTQAWNAVGVTSTSSPTAVAPMQVQQDRPVRPKGAEK
jgi:thermolysin